MALLHRLEQGRLGLGGRPVDLVRQNHVGEDWAGDERESAPAGLGIVLEYVGAGDVRGHHVGRELDASEGEARDPGDGADEQGLGQTGHAHEQDVSAGKESDQELFNHEILADDRLANLVANLPVSLGKLLSGDQVAAASLRCFCRDHANTSIRAQGTPTARFIDPS